MKRIVAVVFMVLLVAATLLTASCTSREERLVREAGREASRLMDEAADRVEGMMNDQ